MQLQRNLHTLDIAVRLLLGAGLVYVGFIDTGYITNSIVRVMLGVFGVVHIGAALLRHCPIYNLAGLSTYRKD